jgi:hypothetical protein
VIQVRTAQSYSQAQATTQIAYASYASRPLPLPFTYHGVLLMLCDAEITHFHTVTDSGLAQAFMNTTYVVHDPVVTASQMRPNKAPQAQGRPYPSLPFPKNDGAPNICELCLDIFGFSGHGPHGVHSCIQRILRSERFNNVYFNSRLRIL